MKAKLTCKLTGASRQSSHKYISKKAEQNGTDVDDYVNHYVTKSAYLDLKQQLQDKPIKVVLEDTGLNGQTVEKILKFNGKSKKTLDDFKNPAKYNQPAEQPTQPQSEVEERDLVSA